MMSELRVKRMSLQYHGGTNFDRTTGVFVATSYDYDAPLDEYGNSFRIHLKFFVNFHDFSISKYL